MQPHVSLVFHNVPSLYPSSFWRNDFIYSDRRAHIVSHTPIIFRKRELFEETGVDGPSRGVRVT